jgi:glyoxylase-like metal-dependent hydrolase (beta-lactamase superfamily II)
MAKPFASEADTAPKTETLEVLANGVYALTAEGDPNVGAVEGEDFVVCIEARATPAAARNWLTQLRRHTDKPVRYLVLTHYHAVRVLGASAFAAANIITSDATARLIAERGQQDWESEFGRMPRLFEQPQEIPGLTAPTETFAESPAVATRPATSSPGMKPHARSTRVTWSRPRRHSTQAMRFISTGPAARLTG